MIDFLANMFVVILTLMYSALALLVGGVIGYFLYGLVM